MRVIETKVFRLDKHDLLAFTTISSDGLHELTLTRIAEDLLSARFDLQGSMFRLVMDGIESFVPYGRGKSEDITWGSDDEPSLYLTKTRGGGFSFACFDEEGYPITIIEFTKEDHRDGRVKDFAAWLSRQVTVNVLN